MDYHIGRLVLSSLRVGVVVAASIWWCLFCRLQHATNREQDDRCGNPSTQSQAPEGGCINVRNMLSA